MVAKPPSCNPLPIDTKAFAISLTTVTLLWPHLTQIRCPGDPFPAPYDITLSFAFTSALPLISSAAIPA